MSLAEATPVDPPDGKSLLAAIKEAVGNDFHDYIIRKMELLRTVGYEEGSQEAEITILLPRDRDPLDTLVSWGLGEIPNLEVGGGTVWDFRFGMRDPNPVKVLEPGGRIEVGEIKPVANAVIRSVNDHPDVPVEVLLPQGIAGVVPFERAKMRLQGRGFELTVPISRSGPAQAGIHIPSSTDPISLDALVDLAHFISMLSDSGVKGFELDGQLGEKRLISRFELDMSAKLPDEMANWAGIVTKTEKLFHLFGLDMSTTISVQSISNQIGDIDFMLALLQPEIPSIRVMTTLHERPSEPAKPWALAHAFSIRLSDKVLFLAGALIGTIGPIEEWGEPSANLGIEVTHFVEHRRLVLTQLDLDAAKAALESIGELYEESHNVLVYSDETTEG